jgi:hypothetical protein
MTTFRLPKFGETYITEVFNKREKLITSRVWGDLDLARLRRWRHNFQTLEEQYLSACLLDSLIYRSAPQTIALARQVFRRLLPDLLDRDGPPRSLPDNWLNQLPNLTIRSVICIVPVYSPTDPPTKSGFVTARVLKRELQISERIILRPQELLTIRPAPAVTLFVDDFLGSGDQFKDFIGDASLGRYLDDNYCIYAPLAGHNKGIENLETAFPSLRIITSDLLTEDHSLFSDTATTFDDGVNSLIGARSFYEELIRTRSLGIPDDGTYGYRGLGLAYAFSHAIPDLTLPLFWWSKARHFEPLFDR